MEIKYKKGDYISIVVEGDHSYLNGLKGCIKSCEEYNSYNVELDNAVKGKRVYLIHGECLRKENPNYAGLFEF